ncbi:MAG TPA: retropepsin-like aspartic protease [Gemmataceae bacterium]|nr:retropepsin-like aspartic protease [Gemmataceae bacterium]
MTTPFDPTRRTIVVPTQLAGPTRVVTVNLLLDTGASDTFIQEPKLLTAGYDPAAATGQYTVATPSGFIGVLEFRVLAFTALGRVRVDFPILAHTFPPGTGHDGVLGLDFFRGNVLTIDFVMGEITLTPGGPTP